MPPIDEKIAKDQSESEHEIIRQSIKDGIEDRHHQKVVDTEVGGKQTEKGPSLNGKTKQNENTENNSRENLSDNLSENLIENSGEKSKEMFQE